MKKEPSPAPRPEGLCPAARCRIAADADRRNSGGHTLTLNAGITSTGMNQQTAAAVTTAVNAYIANPKNQTGVTTVAGTSLQAVGATTMKLTVVLQGGAAASVKGIQTTLTLPAGVLLRTDSSGAVMNGVLTQASAVAPGLLEEKYTAAANGVPAKVTLGFIASGSVTAGDVINLNTDLSPGVSTPAAAAFTFVGSKLVDADGPSVSGTSLAIR